MIAVAGRTAASVVVLAALGALMGCGGGGTNVLPGGSGTPSRAPGEPSPGASSGLVEYEPGAGLATVIVEAAGINHDFGGGTCSQDDVSVATFQWVSGPNAVEPYLEVFITDFDAIQDGEYAGDLTTVDVKLGGEDYLLNPVTVTLRDGQTAGEFEGMSVGAAPVAVSGTFTC